MEKEFDLSNYVSDEPKISYIPTFKVKEFIRLLKDMIDNFEQSGYINDELVDIRSEIDKLAGDKLKEDLKK